MSRLNTPPRPTGTTTQANLNKWFWDKLTSLVFINSSTISFDVTTRGIIPNLKSFVVGVGSTRQGPFQIQSVQDDYVTAFAYDPVNEVVLNTTPVLIAKEDKHQQSLTTETIFGVVHNYSYVAGNTPPNNLSPADANNVFRVDSYGGITEYQRIVPPWVCLPSGDIIYAVSANTGVTDTGDNPVNLLINGRSCQWAQVTQ